MSKLFIQRASIFIGVSICLIAIVWINRENTPPDRSLDQAQVAFNQGHLDEARTKCAQVLTQHPDIPRAHFLLGEIAMQQGDYQTAFESFRSVPVNDDRFVTSRFSAAEAARGLGWIVDAEHLYEAVLNRDSEHLPARERLAFVLDLQGRRFEARQHLYELLRQDQISFSTLIRLGSPESAIPFPEAVEQMRQANRDAAHILLVDAVDALNQNDWKTAKRLLQDAIRSQPSLTEAHARLGRLLVDHDPDRVPNWNEQLPDSASSHPDVWIAQGLWCKQTGQSDSAARCFIEAIKLDPNQRIACTQLGKLLAGLGHKQEATVFAERAQKLQELAAQMNRLSLNRQDTEAMDAASRVLETLGRYWEAYGWCGVMLMNNPAIVGARDRMLRNQSRLRQDPPNSESPLTLLASFDIEEFGLPKFSQDRATTPDMSDPEYDTGIRFVDVAATSGLNFSYFNNHDLTTEGTPMYAFAGGGVGIIDFDCDGWPDINFTQGCEWPPKFESTMHRDQLFRNLGNGSFSNVTDVAGTGDGWFSQGEAIGDVNNDGFLDIYVANIGRNRLLVNHGDGTFSDVADEAGITGEQWTTSCLMADLNGDQSPDLYDVNYLRGDDLFDRLCPVEGHLRACVPGVFPAERDRINIGVGHITFEELQGEEAEVLEPARAGLGVVAWDMDGSGRLSLMIANDVTANALLMNESTTGKLKFSENALLAGIAFDQQGRAQACMGIAADDVDGNGLIDLLVTNYYEEANSLYLQQNPGMFDECSRTHGLFEPSFHQLGFGTQFLDANLDGHPDLVVANGHLDDFTYMDIPRYMNPQFFVNADGGQFRETTQSAGAYFQRKLLGRSLATLDWNRDGRPDFVVSHLEAPASLVSNKTPTSGNWIKISLRGVTSSRVPFGTEVTMVAGDKKWTRQLIGGSGYQSSNELMMLVGLDRHSVIDEISIRWPSGARQQFKNVPANQHVIVIEESDTLLRSFDP